MDALKFKPAQAPLLRLPYELLHSILSLLSDRCACLLVCRRLYEAAIPSVYNEIIIDDGHGGRMGRALETLVTRPHLRVYVRCVQHLVRDIYIDSSSVTWFPELWKLPNLASYTLCTFRGRLTRLINLNLVEAVLRALASCPKLSSVNLDFLLTSKYIPVLECLHDIPALNSVCLGEPTTTFLVGAAEFLKRTPRISALCISDTTSVAEKRLCPTLPDLCHITRLTLGCAYALSLHALSGILQGLPQLEELSLVYSLYESTDPLVDHRNCPFPPHVSLPNLRVLRFQYSFFNISHILSFLKALFGRAPLRVLELVSPSLHGSMHVSGSNGLIDFVKANEEMIERVLSNQTESISCRREMTNLILYKAPRPAVVVTFCESHGLLDA